MRRYSMWKGYEGCMEQDPDGEIVFYQDVITDRATVVLGVPLADINRLINEVYMYSGKTVEEWFKYHDERAVATAKVLARFMVEENTKP